VDFDKADGTSMPYVMPARNRNAESDASDSASAAPDAMEALRQPTAVDPIAALGLDGSSSAPASPKAAPAPAKAPVKPTQIVPPPPAAARQIAAPQAPATQPPVPGTVTPTDQPGARQGRQFTGHPISLDFQGADLRAVLRTFAEISGLNIV